MSRYGGADASFASPLLWISSVKRSEVDWAVLPRHDVFRKRNGSNDFCHQFSIGLIDRNVVIFERSFVTVSIINTTFYK